MFVTFTGLEVRAVPLARLLHEYVELYGICANLFLKAVNRGAVLRPLIRNRELRCTSDIDK